MLNFPDAVGINTFNSYIPRDKFTSVNSNRGPLMINHDYLENWIFGLDLFPANPMSMI